MSRQEWQLEPAKSNFFIYLQGMYLGKYIPGKGKASSGTGSSKE